MQTTLAAPCRVSGRGYWTGQANTLTLLPAEADTGIQFVRTDLPGHPAIVAVAENRIRMGLRTRLKQGIATVDMVEHAMAALYGLQVDNARILCTSEEIPGLDGSSLAFALAIQEAGTIALNAPRTSLTIDETIEVGDEDFVRIEPSAQDEFRIQYELDYGADSPIGAATYSGILSPQVFAEELAPARTFISEQDAAAIQKQGLAVHVTQQDLVVFNDHGPLNNTLRFEDECARHKALDLVGDLALAGVDLVGQVTAFKSGHQLNGDLAYKLRQKAGLLVDSERIAV